MVTVKTKAIKHLMIDKGFKSQVQLAQAAGIHKDRVNKILNGKDRGLTLATINKFCRALECQPGEILEYIPDSE